MSKYEEYIEDLESIDTPSKETVEAAIEALAFVENLNNLLRDNGAVQLPEEPEVDRIGTVLDGVFGELAAVSIFLSEGSFARVPDMMRAVADTIEKSDVEFTDPSGETSKSVPEAVIKGFRDFADRLEASKRQKAEMIGQLQNYVDSQEGS